MNTNDNEHMRMCRDEDLLRFLDTPPGVQRPAALIAAADGATEREVCPDAHLYLRVVMGTIPAEKAADLLTHSASCDTCGQRLAAMTEVLVGNPSEEEIEGIAELALQKEWQQGLARGLAKTRSRRRLLWFSFPSASRVRLTAAALAAAVAAVSALAVWQIQRNKPEQQLARAYFEGRNLELRIPGARFAGMNPDRHTRGSADDRESSPLLEARARLAKALERDPRNAHSLALQARADILGQHYDSATETLDRLISVGPVTAELLCDDASAYYQRGLISGSEVDRSTALDYLRRADTLAPADPVVLFNEAIVMEDRGQMMNAVEVWNRYIIVERDAKWNAEGKRKLASLEQTLNRLKSHQSRLVNMLAYPESLEALAKSPQTLAAWDEELSSMELDKLIPAAFPRNSQWRGVQQARGSPGLDPFCPVPCRTTRRLLRALASSLETQHQDSWLSDLLPPETQDLPDNLFARYVLAIRTLSQATRENQTGIPSTALALSSQAQNLFQTLEAANSRPSPLHTAARVGALRAALEHMFALQRMVAFRECRAFAKDFHSGALSLERLNRYPWIDGVQQLTEKVCDDTGSTRAEGSLLVTRASDLASSHHYRYLAHRARMRVFDDAQNSGDVETAESILMAVLRDLESSDSPLIRITNTFPAYADAEKDSARLYLQELIERESIGWYKATNNSFLALNMEMSLVRTEVKLGNISESERLLHLVESDTKSSTVQTVSTMLTEPRIFIAQAMLERGDVDGAQRNMEQATQGIASFSDNWALQAFAAAKGLLALDHRDYGTAASTLQLQIQTNEGDGSAFVKSKDAAAYAQLDHDLYGELAATWLAQGRSPERVLALWERFRLRSRGVPSADCPGNELDCESGRIVAAQQRLGNDVLIGQIVLLDRVLTYRMDQTSIHWGQTFRRRQQLLADSTNLERAISSPDANLALIEQLGGRLADSVLPEIHSGPTPLTKLYLETDPSLQNLPWPAMPTRLGPLGLIYPMTDLRSILADREAPPPLANGSSGELIIGASTASQGLAPLPEAMEEARLVSQYAHAPRLLIGEQATSVQLAKALDSATSLHFAGHAVQNSKGTRLLLASASPTDPAPWIDGAFLRRHPPRYCKLAILDACATGRRKADWNSPLQDIVETLGAIGVEDVVATRWQIDSNAAVPFMRSLYDNLARGKDISVALLEARKLQSNRSQDNTPYYWAAYYVTETENARTESRQHGRK